MLDCDEPFLFFNFYFMANYLLIFITKNLSDELILNNCEQKDNIKTFLMDFNIEETLYREFVIETNMDVSEFYETYEKSLEDHFGKLY